MKGMPRNIPLAVIWRLLLLAATIVVVVGIGMQLHGWQPFGVKQLVADKTDDLTKTIKQDMPDDTPWNGPAVDENEPAPSLSENSPQPMSEPAVAEKTPPPEKVMEKATPTPPPEAKKAKPKESLDEEGLEDFLKDQSADKKKEKKKEDDNKKKKKEKK